MLRHLEELERRHGPFARNRAGGIGPPLGRGSFGCVLPLADPTRVLKITEDDEEGPLSLYVRDLQQARASMGGVPVIAATARVYDVFRFPGQKECYGIVRERVACGGAISGIFALVADSYAEAWDYAYDAARVSDRARYEAQARKALHAMRTIPHGDRLAEILLGFWKLRVPLMDAHRDNLCLRTRRTDLGGREGDVLLMDYGASNPGRSLGRVGSLSRMGPVAVAIQSEVHAALASHRRRIPFLNEALR